MFDSEFAYEIYKAALDIELVRQMNLIAQVSVGFAVLVTFMQKVLIAKNSMNDHDKLRPGDIMRPIILMGLIFTYPYFLDLLDYLTVGLEKFIKSNTPKDLGYKELMYEDLFKEAKDIQGLDKGETMNYYLRGIFNRLTHPGIWIMEDFRSVFYFLDNIIFGVALLSRSFKLFILRLVGSFAILASLYHRYEGYAASWVKYYFLNYLWVTLLFAINYFTDVAFFAIREKKLGGGIDSYGFVSTLSYIVILFVKLKLYKKSFDFLARVFSNA